MGRRDRVNIDFQRLSQAVERPGIDPRAWGQMARVDGDDPDTVVWDAQLGWLCDVTMVGGALDGDGPVLCRVPSGAQGDGVGSYRPPRPTGLVVVQIPTADPNDEPIIVAQLHSEDDTAPALAPIAINGEVIVESDAIDGQVAAIETHMDIFPSEDLDQEWRNVRVTVSVDGTIRLAAPDAEQPFARGDDLADALGDMADATSDVVTAISTALSAAGSPLDPASLVTFEAAVATFKAARDGYLSQRIFGD